MPFRRLLLVLVALLAAAPLVWFGGLGPRGPLPGGFLWGEVVREVPSDWDFTDRVAHVQLETRLGPFPYSVTIWCLANRGRLYVPSGDCGRRWTRQVLARPDVRVRIDGKIYALRAARASGDALSAALAPRLLEKYFGIAVDSAYWVEGERGPGCIFRLDPRS